jgi:FkbM family methyltransferase
MLRDRERALLGAQAAMRRWLRLDVRRWAPSGVAGARRLAILKDAGVTTVLDVGANRGQFAKELRAGGYAENIVSFEPLGAAFAALEEAARDDPRWECRQLALSDSEGEAELHVAGNAVSSSLLDMEARHLEAAPESRYVGSERVRQVRLDTLVDELGLPVDGVYLKVDVQGLESRVIEGARAALPRIVAVESELSLVPLYSGQLLFREMLDLLDDAGYQPVSLEAAYADPRNGHVLQVDGIFLRRATPSVA